MRGAEPGAGAQSSAGTPEPRTQSPKLRVQIPVQLPSLKTQGAQHPEPEPEPEPCAQDGRNRSAQQGAGFTESGYLSPGAAAGAADRLCQQVLPRCPRLGRGPELGPDDSMGEEDPGVEPESRDKKTPDQSSQNKTEPVPTAWHMLVMRTCVPSRRGATGPSPKG